jgi:hypothetical protein
MASIVVTTCKMLNSFRADAANYKDVETPTVVDYCVGKKPDIVTWVANMEGPEHPFVRGLSRLCRGEIRDWNIIGSMEGATNVLIVYEKGPNITGFAIVTVSAPITRVHIVCAGEKGKGIGTLLLDKTKELATKAGSTSIRLKAISKDLVEKVYKPQGFKAIEPSGDDFEDSVGDGETLMEYELSKGGSHKLRLNVKGGRTKRHRGGRKHRKTRKLTSRRR